MKCLFLNPAFSYIGKDLFPLGLAYIVAIAQQRNNEITVVDENIGDIIPWDRLGTFDLIGITLSTPAFFNNSGLLARLVKQKAPHALIIAGGHHPTFRPEEVLRMGINYVMRGESDLIFSQFLENLHQPDKLHATPGLSYIAENQTIYHNSQAALQQNLDSLPFPNRSCFNYSKYHPMSLTGSRGCPYRCSFCAAAAFWEHRIRFRSIPNIIAELDSIMQLHPYSLLKFQDSVFTLQKDRTIALLTAMSENNYSFQWICETRVDCLDRETIQLMHHSGCKSIMIGLESGAQQILDRNDRHMKVQQITDCCNQIMQDGIGLRVSVIFGLPGETDETIHDTLTILRQIRPNVTFLNLATIYPGCALENHPTGVHNEIWLRRYGGHGVGGGIVLPEGMTASEYRKYAEYLQREIHLINKINWVHENPADF